MRSNRSLKVGLCAAVESAMGVSLGAAAAGRDEKRVCLVRKLGFDHHDDDVDDAAGGGTPSHAGTWCAIDGLCVYIGYIVKE